jgi:hypothetical protein
VDSSRDITRPFSVTLILRVLFFLLVQYVLAAGGVSGRGSARRIRR